ncbi:type II toxin-antitoxin system HipA family toxin [Marinobacter sp. SS8-8]|uniref:type II toxin-antitoxin system HipA family toxin n=2 Tax=Marinobacter sp. SS8-8 TaxID=3050452 RepID=UPI0026DF2AB3|nr:type II toxin-antitoxin system HipA family toxin [Marinobacter sp. SS8-8]|tara:strand:- start:58 stop:1326 length:1269 start_codon:yes stop_codon:yes gene_type:complete
MTSKNSRHELYVWVWLPGEVDPVAAGRIYRTKQGSLYFNYGNSYLQNQKAISLNPDELPLRKGSHRPVNDMTMPSCLRDGSPDAWGRRVIIHRMMGSDADTAELDELTYLIESGSDRIGALDFQESPNTYVPRETDSALIAELLEASDRVQKGLPLTPELDRALNHGTSIGGARPKALVQDGKKKYVAKFSSTTDTQNVVKAEYVAMRLAELAGINVAPVRMESAAGRDVLLVERFDRIPKDDQFQRKLMLSALTLFQLDEMYARYASYEELTDLIRQKFHNPTQTLQELYRRMVFNILCGNTDDHARNHAAFYDGNALELTPAYDICPQNRSTGIASQAMALIDGNNQSTLALCKKAAHKFNLTEVQANENIESLQETIRAHWDQACEEAKMTELEKKFFWKRQFLNPSIYEGGDHNENPL